MKKVIVLVLAFIFVPCISFAASGHITLTVSSTATGFTVTDIPQYATGFTCSLEGGNIRFWLDGQNPTSTVGHLWLPGQFIRFKDSTDIPLFRGIRTAGTDGTLSCSFEQESK